MGKALTDQELRETLKFEQEDADVLKQLSRNTTPSRGAFAQLGALKARLEAGHPKLVKEAQAETGPIVIMIEDGEVKEVKGLREAIEAEPVKMIEEGEEGEGGGGGGK